LGALRAGDVVRLGCQARVEGPVTVRRLALDLEDEALVDRRRTQGVPGRVGEERKVAVLFADLQGFTSFAEGLFPYDVVHVLNRFFGLADRAVGGNGGRIASFLGDGFMAVFEEGSEQDHQEDCSALRAVLAGIDLLEGVAGLEDYLEGLYGRSLTVSVGIHLGRAVVGSIGVGSARVVTAIGDVVNTAARIESANREFGTRMLMSEEVAAALRDRVATHPLPPVTLRGKRGSHTLYSMGNSQ
jgi:adenylate cyclase